MASISERERGEIEAANASGTTPVLLIHGLWLLPSSWAKWADFFDRAGYAPLTPDWPDDPETVEEARATPDVLARKTLKQVADHTTEIMSALDRKPVVIGHSTGGLLAQMLAGRGLSAATVAIDPGVFRGVLPLPARVHELAENRRENVGKAFEPGAAAKGIAAILECRLAEAVIGGALLRVLEAFIGLADRLEARFLVGAAAVAVGMAFLG